MEWDQIFQIRIKRIKIGLIPKIIEVRNFKNSSFKI